ncbi:recombinase family protein [Roseateles chitinivorans]|uniref:recombinase family protein n=1 Tax=Roseateles chitinivorans TaxID=2917965 RepID=UPI003D668B03
MQSHTSTGYATIYGATHRAAEYVRMSTEHQQYSTQNQADKIREYAAQRGVEIVRTYADEGRSGLRLDGRDALKRLLSDVQSGGVDFNTILVYDVSRWGRFQDADESAYYEYMCRRAGIQVAYCAEQFENDGSPVSTIVKGVKRAMAGEYSRELSAKVFAGQCRLIELGFRQGGPAGIGLRRVLIDSNGALKAELARGEHKSLQTDRVVLRPGPEDEILLVRDVYNWFVNEGLDERAIVDRLNASGRRTDLGRPWSRSSVREVLSNEKYIGHNVYNRISFKLKKLRVRNPPEMWIRKEHAFEAIVPPDLFYTAQGILRARGRRFSDDELIARLKAVFQSRGYLSGLVIDEAEELPGATVYAHRFGGLLRAYQLVGFNPGRDYCYLEINRQLRRMHPELVLQVETEIEKLGGAVQRDSLTDLLSVNAEFTASIVLARCHRTSADHLRWKVRMDASLVPDITVAARLNEENDAIKDFYLLPRVDFNGCRVRLAEHNAAELETYRFETLDYLYGMACRARLKVAA